MPARSGRGRDSDPRRDLGLRGERIAEARLVAEGYRIVARRWRVRTGEIDLVADDGGTVVFVEVKTRRGTSAGTPAEAVTPAKAARIARLALAFLHERGWLERRARFDVVEVLAPPGGAPRVRHLRDAFRPSQDPRGGPGRPC